MHDIVLSLILYLQLFKFFCTKFFSSFFIINFDFDKSHLISEKTIVVFGSIIKRGTVIVVNVIEFSDLCKNTS